MKEEINMIKYLEKENLSDLVKEGIHLVDFYADWCGPCKMLGSVLEKLEDVSIIKINTDTHQDIARDYGIMSIPTIVFFKDGQEVKKEIGFKDEEQLRNLLESIR